MAELVSIKRNVDVSPGQAAPAVFHCSQGDVGSKIILGLLNNGTAYSIPSGVTVTIEGSESNGSIFTPISATVFGSDITFYLTGEMTAVAGPAICQAVLKSGSNILGTANFTLEVESSPMGADAPPVFTDAGWTWMLNKLNTEFVPALGNETIIDAIESKADQSDLTALSNTVAGHTGSITVLNNTVNTLNRGVTENRQNIALKLDKNQGTANAGKYLKVGADGNVTAEELDVTTDKTLSITDKAADAKAVGDELTDLKAGLSESVGDLKSALNNISDTVEDLDTTVNGIHVSIEYIPNEYVENDGTFKPYTNWSRTNFVPVPNDGNWLRYTLTGRPSAYCAFYSDTSESSYLQMFSINKTDGIPYRENPVPDNARYFVISNFTDDIATFTYLNPPSSDVGLVATVDNLDDRVTALESSQGSTPEIILPPYAVAVVGHEFNMYTENVVICDNINNYIWAWRMLPYATQYNQYDDRFSVIPAVGSERTYTLSLTCIDKTTGGTITSASMSLIVVSDSAITEKKMLMIGDSLTASGYSAYEIQSVLSANGVESLGTLTAAPWIGNVRKNVNMEGRGGWGAYDYMHTASKNGNTNAFLNPSTNLFDFSYYMSQQGYTGIDIVLLNLGTNGMEDIQRDVEAMGQIIASIHSYNANIPVVVHLTPPPATQNGWTYINHGEGAEEFRLKTLSMVKAQIEAFGNKQSEKTYISCVYGCLDRYHDFAYREEVVSQRNPFTVIRQIQNVHPSAYGYYKFADVYWGMIKYLLT